MATTTDASIPFLDLKATTASQRPALDDAIKRVLNSAHYLFGPDVAAFEDEFAAWLSLGSDDVPPLHCVGAANGTSAISMALHGAGVKPGDVVVTQANTFAATVAASDAVGASVVLVDCDDRGRMDLDQAFAAVKAHGAKVLLVVHLYGECVDMDAVAEFQASVPGLLVVEDCAQSHGTAWKGRKVGTFGDAGCFSFYPGKNLGALGDAGAVVSRHPDLADAARTYGNIGAKLKYHHVVSGINSRMDTLQAAALRVKLPALDGWNAARRQVAAWYEAEIKATALRASGVALLQPPSGAHPDMTHTYHLVVLKLPNRRVRDAVRQALNDRGIGCLVHYPFPCHKMPAFGYAAGDSHPVAEDLAHRILSLPCYPTLTRAQAARVVAAVKDAMSAL